jgi:transcriptional regulator with XRE-family HTH domain
METLLDNLSILSNGFLDSLLNDMEKGIYMLDNMTKPDICSRTAEARKLSGKDPKEIAKALGVEYHAYNKYETRSIIKTHLVGKFCKITGVRPEWLIDGILPITKEEEIRDALNDLLSSQLMQQDTLKKITD